MPPGKTAMYFRKSKTAASSVCCTPVEPLFFNNSDMKSSAFFCLSERTSGLRTLNSESPGMYDIISCFAASLKASSDSAEHGMNMVSGNSFFRFSMFFSAPGMSILFRAIRIGFVFFLSRVESFFISSWDHCSGFSSSFASSIAFTAITSVIFIADSCSAISISMPFLVMLALLASFLQLLQRIDAYQRSISFSRNLTSFAGSWFPAPIGSPFSFVDPDASTTCISTSAWLRSLRNWFPRPLPSCAPGTRPATSTISTGTNLV